MLLVNGKAMLKIGNRYIAPGENLEVPEGLGKKLKEAGLATDETKPKGKAGKKNGPKTKNSTGS
jgi:hypothetical protein